MNRNELDRILKDHAAWLKNNCCGKRANLTGADLRSENLRGADLRDADMTDADLRSANLRGADLRGADLRGADMTDADMIDADLRDADIDYSCWPLWCGSLGAVVDKRIFCQLAYHLCRVKVDDEDCRAAQRALAGLANQFHRVDECGRIEFDKETDGGRDAK